MNDPIITLGTVANTSYTWQIENCVMKCDVCQLDSGVDNKYDERLITGGDLKFNFYRIISNLQTIATASSQINISRSCPSLCKVFVSFDKDLGTERAKEAKAKWWNSFYSPMAGDVQLTGAVYDASKEIQGIQLQVGSKVYPGYQISSHGESFYHLRKALGIAANNLHSLNITGLEYRYGKFITAIDLERVLEASYTGIDTANSLITLKVLLDSSTAGAAYLPNRVHAVLVSECVLEINNSGVSVYE